MLSYLSKKFVFFSKKGLTNSNRFSALFIMLKISENLTKAANAPESKNKPTAKGRFIFFFFSSTKTLSGIAAGELLALLCCEASAAVNGSVALRLKGNLCYAAAASAGCLKESSGASAVVLLSVTARLASLGLVGEALLCVELLLAGSEYEVSAAVLAS